MDVDYQEPRFVTPICTVQDVADLVGMPLDTVNAWAGQRSSRRQMFTREPQDHRGWPTVPLVGLVEANTLRTLREMLAPSEVETPPRVPRLAQPVDVQPDRRGCRTWPTPRSACCR